MNTSPRKFLALGALLVGIYITIRYLLPLLSPFLLGGALALAAEPVVNFLCRRLRLPRGAAAAIGVGLSFALLTVILLILTALLLRQLRALTMILPDLESTIRGGMGTLSNQLTGLAEKIPGGISGVVQGRIQNFFSGGSALLDKAGAYLLHLASGMLKRVPGRALSFGTAVIASFMISAKLPKLKSAVRRSVHAKKLLPVLEMLQRLRTALCGWLKAQAKLSGITFAVACGGLLLLRIPYAPFWAGIIALVDAFPALGTGAVLVPWSLVSFLQGDRLPAFGLLGLYLAAVVTRTVLEPRLVGKQLGLDPLVTLVSLYVGFRLFGIAGMLLSPLIAVTVTQLVQIGE